MDDSLQARPAPAEADSVPTTGFLPVAWIASVLFVVVSFMPREGPAKYRWSFVFLVPIVWGTYALRRKLVLRPLHFALFALAILLHDLGAFGWYQRSFAGLHWDWVVHSFFGLVGGLIVAEILRTRFGVRGRALAILAVLVVGGFGALHEIVEAVSSMLLGPEYGMLRVGADNPYDTQIDLFNNVMGASVAVWLHLRRRHDSRVALTK